jgi:hypothetical protein
MIYVSFIRCCANEFENSPNNAINSDAKKLRCAPLFVSGYGWR